MLLAGPVGWLLIAYLGSLAVLFVVGSVLFAYATHRTRALPGPGAALLAFGSLAAIAAFVADIVGGPGEILGPIAIISVAIGWIAIGWSGIRVGSPAPLAA